MHRSAQTPTQPAVYRPEPIETAAPAAPLPYLSYEPIPGATECRTRDGVRVWLSFSQLPVQTPTAAEPQSSTALPRWVKIASLLPLSLACSAVLGSYALGLAAEALGDLAAALAALLAIVARVAVVLLVLVGALVVVYVVKRPGRGSSSATATSTATARGLFGKATATATATAGRK